MSKLPVVSQPTFEEKVPSNDSKIHFRPFVVKEEKILLIAQEGSSSDVIRAIKDVLNVCIQEDVDVNKLTTFDLEYLFLKLRAKSVNNIAKVSYEDHEDGKVRDFEIDLDKVEVQFNEANNPKIDVTDTIKIVMKFPAAEITDKLVEFDNESDMMMFFIVNSIDTIYDGETVYPASEYSEQELEEFLDGLSVATFEQIKKFFETMPRLYHKIEYVNDNGTERTIEFKTLRDFFTWG